MNARLEVSAIPPGVRAALRAYLSAERDMALDALAAEPDETKVRQLQGRVQFQSKLLRVLDV